jgi:hypothetical protein
VFYTIKNVHLKNSDMSLLSSFSFIVHRHTKQVCYRSIQEVLMD